MGRTRFIDFGTWFLLGVSFLGGRHLEKDTPFGACLSTVIPSLPIRGNLMNDGWERIVVARMEKNHGTQDTYVPCHSHFLSTGKANVSLSIFLIGPKNTIDNFKIIFL